MNNLANISRHLFWLSGILLGLSYLSLSDFHQAPLACMAFIPLLISIKNDAIFRSYFPKIVVAYSLTILIGFWWAAYYKLVALPAILLSQILFFNVPFVLHYFLQKRFGWTKALIILPFQWSFIEWLTHHFPHNLQVFNLGYTQANLLYFNQIADFSGLWGLSFWVMMLNSLLTLGIVLKQKKYYFLSFCWLLMAFSYGFYRVQISPQNTIGKEHKTSKVSIIQTNIDTYKPLDNEVLETTFNQLVTLSDSAVRNHKPDLLLLPEATFPFALFQDSSLFQFTRKAVETWQTSLAIGYSETIDSSLRKYQNKSLLFTPQLATYWDSLNIKPEQIKVYEKEFGLPFMEMMPYCANCPSFQNRILVGGNRPFIFNYLNSFGENFNVALTICWEQTHPNKLAKLVKDGAEYIALMNNDAWFGKTPAARYLVNITKIRAIENRRSIARCSNGGISCFIDPFGRVYGSIPWFTADVSTANVMMVRKRSFYTHYPNFFAIMIGFTGFGLMVFYSLRKN
jgi:apolipoprotein N-acyltransferase